MAYTLIIPVCPHVDAAKAAANIAAKLPNAAVFNAMDYAGEAVRLEGKADDWFDLLVGRAAALGKENVVIQGITPNDAYIFLSRQNNGLATAFNARVVFAVSNEHATAERLQMAKASFAGRNVEFAGVVGGTPKQPVWTIWAAQTHPKAWQNWPPNKPSACRPRNSAIT